MYHAAAYKHVPITEVSVIAAARTNVLGTVETIRAARDVGARFLLVSSDKAADPRSVMGATKRLAELVATYQRSRLFRPVVVRFGNILGSSGSVVEIMAEAVRQGRNIPVTDPSATRFFMTAEEAVVAGDQGRSDGPRRRRVLARDGPGASHRRSGAAHHRVGHA